MSVTDEYLKNNEAYASTFTGPLPLPPSKHVAVVACMDARLDVYRILGLGDGEAHVIRNAGGVITDDEIRSLAISQRLLGTKEIILIHHTDCGMLTFTDDGFKQQIQDETGIKPRRGCASVAAPNRGQPVRHQARIPARVHLRRRHRPPRGSHALGDFVGRDRLTFAGAAGSRPRTRRTLSSKQDIGKHPIPFRRFARRLGAVGGPVFGGGPLHAATAIGWLLRQVQHPLV
jgi:carbonic anhydrase